MPKIVTCLTLASVTAALVVGCTTDRPTPESSERTGGDQFVLVTKYEPEGCRSVGSTRKFVSPGRAVDVDGDDEADLIHSGNDVLVRSASYPLLGADRPWVHLPSASDSFGEPGIRELAMESILGPDLKYLLTGQHGEIPVVESYVRAGSSSPQRVSPNTVESWQQAPDGSIKSIEVSHEDAAASFGVSTQSYDLRSRKLAIPAEPPADEVLDAGDLPAVAFLESTAQWKGDCRNEQAFLSPDKLACYRKAVGDATAHAWMASRVERSWTDPDECGLPD